MGRTRKTLNKKQIEKLEILAGVLTKQQIADYFGIGLTCYKDMEKRNSKISDSYKRGRSSAINDIAGSLLTKARKGDTASMIFFLKTQAGWRETQIIQQETKEVKSFSSFYD